MANDLRLAVRRACVAALRADAALTALVPPSSIYGPQTPAEPAWPFVRFGAATVLPDRASGLDGAQIIVTVHAFARGPGEDDATQIAAAVASALESAPLATEDGDTIDCFWRGGQSLRDTDEADAWHATADFELTIGGNEA